MKRVQESEMPPDQNHVINVQSPVKRDPRPDQGTRGLNPQKRGPDQETKKLREDLGVGKDQNVIKGPLAYQIFTDFLSFLFLDLDMVRIV